MSAEAKLKHLEFIQSVINRLAGNSFLLKGWSVTLVAALFAFAAKDGNKNYVLVAYLPVLIFWNIDAYFLSRERMFRGLYDSVREKKEDETDFSMDTQPFRTARNNWPCSFVSVSLILFYLPLAGTMLLLMYLIH
jgi:hypothetical protein